jgi:hypothetical protein
MFDGDIAAGPVPTLFAENVDEALDATPSRETR